MSCQAPETSMDHYAASLQTGMMTLRGHKLHERSKETNNTARRHMLRCMSHAYNARGLACAHRLAGSVDTALRLEAQAESFLLEARQTCFE